MYRSLLFKTELYCFFNNVKINVFRILFAVFYKLEVTVRMLMKNILLPDGLPVKNIYEICRSVGRQDQKRNILVKSFCHRRIIIGHGRTAGTSYRYRFFLTYSHSYSYKSSASFIYNAVTVEGINF